MATKRTARSFLHDDLNTDDHEAQPCQAQSQAQAVASRKGSMAALLEPPADKADASTTRSSSSTTGSVSFVSPDKPASLTAAQAPAVMERSVSLSSLESSSVSISSAYSSASSNAHELASHDAVDAALFDLPAGAPLNFGEVIPGLYRSSYPQPENYDFLKQLGLKTIVTLVDKNFTEEYGKFMTANNIQHHIITMKGTKKEEIPLSTMKAILELVLDRKNYPLLIHCNHGKHRTGCVVAVVRKIAGWDSTELVHEYKAYAGIKERDCDVEYMGKFQLATISDVIDHQSAHVRDLETFRAGPMINATGTPSRRVRSPFRVSNFLRSAAFSMTVLFIWIVSGSKMPQQERV